MRQANEVLYRKIQLPFKIKRPILAFGAQTKNTVCFAKDDFAYLSPVHSRLDNLDEFLRFEKTIEHFLKKNPQIFAYDLHPEYQSTKYAQGLRPATYGLRPIQHHHAHIASCMAENAIGNQDVIGVAFDGTGLGTDHTLWGAEFFIANYKNFKRAAHLRYIPLLGAERAIVEPWRLSAWWLYQAYQERFLNIGIKFVKGMNKKKWQALKKMYLSDFNSPLASSMGRLFDAAASLILAKYKVNFEAELAIELEKIATGYNLQATSYKFKIIKQEDGYLLEPLGMFKQIVSDLKAKEPKEKIALRFHLTIAEMIRKACLILNKDTGIKKVVLSGGVFQNKVLLRLSLDLLCREGLAVFVHRQLPSNDAGISLGQAAIANFNSRGL